MEKRVLDRLYKYKLQICLISFLTCFGVGWAFNIGLQAHEMAILATSVSNQQVLNTGGQSNLAPQAMSPVNTTVHKVTQAAIKFGVLSCLKRINQVATFLTADNSSGVFVLAPHNPPDQHVITTSFELIRSDNSMMYATASFFPNNDAVYDTVEYVEMSCEDVEKSIFKNLKHIGVLKNNIIMLDGGSVKVYLMPAGSGCIVIKKELL